MAHDVFVSYAKDDKATADALVATLEQQQIRCWVAPRDVTPGKDYAASLVQAINSSRVMVLVFSSSANTSPHVMREIERAASKSIPILPLRIEDVSLSESMEFFISSTHWLDALTPPLQQHLERLARSVAALLDAAGVIPGTDEERGPQEPEEGEAVSEVTQSPLLIHTLTGHTRRVEACAISPDGSFIVSASWDETLKIWDAQTGEERATLKGHTGMLNACAISPDGSFIVSASEDHTLKIWDAQTGEERATLAGHTKGYAGTLMEDQAGKVEACAISPDGSFIVSGGWDKTLKVWDAQTGEERATLAGHTGIPHFKMWQPDLVNACAISPDSSFIVSAARDNTLKIWDARTGKEQATLGSRWPLEGVPILGALTKPSTGHTSSVGACAISPDGSFIVSASWDNTLKIWDARSGLNRATLAGHTDKVMACAISPDGSFIVSSGWDNTLKVWDARTGQERATLTGHTAWVEACAISPDGSFIVSASWDETLKIWDAQTGEERATLKGHTGMLNACAISPDGSFIVSASADHTLKIWAPEAG